MEALVGTALGGFKLIRALGSGPTGETYAALDSASAPNAIKIIHPALSLFTRAEAFWNELRTVTELAHPHITVAGAADWSKSGRFFLSMDLLEGLSLEDVLKQHGRLPAAQALLVAGQVCLALEAAHDERLVHAALKPRNIFLVPHGDDPCSISTRLLDFATTCLLGNAPPPGAAGSPGVPEPAYLAPEQFSGSHTSASDIYSLGAVLFEALTGRRPFVGSYTELAAAHAKRPLQIPSSIPPELAPVLRRALAKAPEQRFDGAAEFRQALEAWAACSPAALEEPPLVLFPKESELGGVAQLEGDQTIRVSVDELEASVFESEPEPEPLLQQPLRAVAGVSGSPAPSKATAPNTKKGQSMSEVKKPKVLEDHELAAIAERAATPLRSRPESAASAVAATTPATQPAAAPQPTEAYFDEDDDLVELPLEKSVRAFVANLLPVPPPPKKASRPGGNGESLEAALEEFVQEAKHLNEALPPPVVDDRRLAELAKVPVIEEAPPPVVVAAPLVSAAPVSAVPVSAMPVGMPAPPVRRGGVLLPSLLAFVLGGAAVFGAYKLFLEKPAGNAAGPASQPGEATLSGSGTGAAGTAPAAKLDTGSGQTGVAAAPPDAAPQKPDVTAAASSEKPDSAPSAAAEPEEPKAPKKAQKVAKKVRKAAPKKEGVSVKPKRAPKIKKTDEPKEKKSKKGGSDWVDPFSQ